MTEIVVAQQVDHLLNAHTPFGRHQLRSLVGQGRVKTDSHMTVALIQEPFQFVLDADTAHRDTFRAPCIAVVGCQDFRSSQHVVEIVHRFALSHEHDVGECVALGKGVDLVEDVSC